MIEAHQPSDRNRNDMLRRDRTPPKSTANLAFVVGSVVRQSRLALTLSVLLGSTAMLLSGCHSLSSDPGAASYFRDNTLDFSALNPPEQAIRTDLPIESRLDQLAGVTQTPAPQKPSASPVATPQTAVGSTSAQLASRTGSTGNTSIVRAQSPQDDNRFSPGGFGFPSGSPGLVGQSTSSTPAANSGLGYASRIGTSASSGSSNTRTANYQGTQETGQQPGTIRRDDAVTPTVAQFPEFDTPDRPFIPGNRLSSPNIGSPNELNPLVQPFERGGNAAFPMNYADLDVYVAETQTGRFNFGGAYNSDNGIVGQFTIDEKNFDITRFPRSLREIMDGTAWRGAGQQFRLELVPGANLERYLVSFTEPYLLGTDYSLSVSGYLFDRNYFDWDEQRLGGRVSMGRRLSPDISINLGLRMESVVVDNARTNTSTQLNDSLGSSNLFLFNAGLVRDTRDSMVNATEGTYLSMNFTQAFGDYNYTRGDLDFRTYRLMYERPDGSGRHTVSVGTKLGFSGSSTPIFENYFAGGFSTLRGFDFRGAAPNENGVRVGGEFQWLNTVEYMFPLTADDALKGVLFCDFGTVEESIEINSENFRVAPGFGFRVAMPGAAGGAPLAFDFAFPIATAEGDDEKVFSFYLGVLR